jgi:hypothetical protein
MNKNQSYRLQELLKIFKESCKSIEKLYKTKKEKI